MAESKQKKTRYTVKDGTIHHDGKVYETGSAIDLTPDQARQLSSHVERFTEEKKGKDEPDNSGSQLFDEPGNPLSTQETPPQDAQANQNETKESA